MEHETQTIPTAIRAVCNTATDDGLTRCRAADKVKKELSQQYNVPLFPPKPKPQNFAPGAEVHPYNVRRAAVALKTQGHKLPEKRREELQQLVRGYVNQDKPGSQIDGSGWLSQDEMQSALLAGLAPRQKRRTLRQLAAEKAASSDRNGLHAQHDGTAAHSEYAQAEQFDSASDNFVTTEQTGHASDTDDSAADPQAQHDTTDRQSQMPDQLLHDTSTAVMPCCRDTSEDLANGAHSSAELHSDDQLCDAVPKDEAMTAAQHAESNGHLWHGKNVVAAAMAEGGTDALLLLIQRFRKAFTDALHPQFLPAAWHIFHNAERDFGEHSVYAS